MEQITLQGAQVRRKVGSHGDPKNNIRKLEYSNVAGNDLYSLVFKKGEYFPVVYIDTEYAIIYNELFKDAGSAFENGITLHIGNKVTRIPAHLFNSTVLCIDACNMRQQLPTTPVAYHPFLALNQANGKEDYS